MHTGILFVFGVQEREAANKITYSPVVGTEKRDILNFADNSFSRGLYLFVAMSSILLMTM